MAKHQQTRPHPTAAARAPHAVGDRATLAQLAAEHVARARRQQMRGNCKPRTVVEIEKLYRSAILPELGAGRALSSLTELDIERWHADLTERGPVWANRAAACLRAGFRLAERWRWIEPYSSPLAHLSEIRNEETPRDRVLTHAESARLFAELERFERVPGWRAAAIAVRVLALTGARKNEVLLATWSEAHLDDAEPYLLLVNHKSSRTNGPKRVYLCPDAVDALRRVPCAAGETRIFPTPNFRRVWERLRRLICEPGLELPIVHDLRTTFCSRLAEAGVPAEDVAALLDQKTVKVQIESYRFLQPAHKAGLANRGAAAMLGAPKEE